MAGMLGQKGPLRFAAGLHANAGTRRIGEQPDFHDGYLIENQPTGYNRLFSGGL
jgi:hypothetical protein